MFNPFAPLPSPGTVFSPAQVLQVLLHVLVAVVFTGALGAAIAGSSTSSGSSQTPNHTTPASATTTTTQSKPTAKTTTTTAAPPEPTIPSEPSSTTTPQEPTSPNYNGQQPEPHQNPHIKQGDEFIAKNAGSCTIGYIDRARRVAYTAAHCGGANFDNVRETYIKSCSNGKCRTKFLGFMQHIKHWQPHLKFEDDHDYKLRPYVDIAAIKIREGINLGENKYSGDTVVPFENVNIGDEACFYGNTTQNTVCGKVVNKYSDWRRLYLQTDSGQATIPGDSGGIVFLKNGGGAIGVIKGRDSIGGVAATGF